MRRALNTAAVALAAIGLLGMHLPNEPVWFSGEPEARAQGVDADLAACVDDSSSTGRDGPPSRRS
jgi:hypothetical protein